MFIGTLGIHGWDLFQYCYDAYELVEDGRPTQLCRLKAKRTPFTHFWPLFSTVGFGDYHPEHSSTKILLFPFAIVTLSLLANLVSMIVSYISDSVAVRRDQWRAAYAETAEKKFGEEGSEPTDLNEEMKFLTTLHMREEQASRVFDLVVSILGFLCFWVIGAMILAKMEGWAHGDSLYFCYIVFFTIGFGDYSPSSAAGKTFFVIYSLMAVPLIASFALQSVSLSCFGT